MGITDLVKRPTARASEVTPDEIAWGSERLRRLILQLELAVVCLIYEKALEPVLTQRVTHRWGAQPERIGASRVFLLPFPYVARGVVAQPSRYCKVGLALGRRDGSVA